MQHRAQVVFAQLIPQLLLLLLLVPLQRMMTTTMTQLQLEKPGLRTGCSTRWGPP